MLNHYEILGLQNGAGISEIKAAFRQLAKLYHPDLNPEGKEHFSRVLKAYEILSDPQLKNAYDYKLNSNKGYDEASNAPVREKQWKFDERELKRRQYYNDHIRKYEKKTAGFQTQAPVKSNYNEFKYILLATPLAVLLFVGIMSLASGQQKKEPPPVTQTEKNDKEIKVLQMGVSPYSEHFGESRFTLQNGSEIKIQNLSSAEIILCIFEKGVFIRSCYIEPGFSAHIRQLPSDAFEIRYCVGMAFDPQVSIAGTLVKGIFRRDLQYFESLNPVQPGTINQLTLLPGANEGFKTISAAKFFRKSYDQEN